MNLTESQKVNREAQLTEVMAAHTALRERMVEKHDFDPDTIDWNQTGEYHERSD